MTFIGHSLGGIIVRAALPYLSEFSNQMHSFMTLSSPHLGYMYNSSKIIDAGKIINSLFYDRIMVVKTNEKILMSLIIINE